jgi:hypothetical protein
MDIASLISTGKLQPGTKLSWKRRLTGLHTVTVQADGSLVSDDGRKHKSPSGAAKAISGKPVDGWSAWKLPNGNAIGTLR